MTLRERETSEIWKLGCLPATCEGGQAMEIQQHLPGQSSERCERLCTYWTEEKHCDSERTAALIVSGLSAAAFSGSLFQGQVKSCPNELRSGDWASSFCLLVFSVCWVIVHLYSQHLAEPETHGLQNSSGHQETVLQIMSSSFPSSYFPFSLPIHHRSTEAFSRTGQTLLVFAGEAWSGLSVHDCFQWFEPCCDCSVFTFRNWIKEWPPLSHLG